MNGNGFIAALLRSPLHGMLSRGMMLITVTGSKTGRKYTIPVGYFSTMDALWILTSRNRTWWRNLRSGAEVDLLLRGSHTHGFAKAILDDLTVQVRLAEYLRHEPRAAAPLGIRMNGWIPDQEDIARVARDRLFVKVCLG